MQKKLLVKLISTAMSTTWADSHSKENVKQDETDRPQYTRSLLSLGRFKMN